MIKQTNPLKQKLMQRFYSLYKDAYGYAKEEKLP